MIQENNNIDDLLVKYLLGEASPDERAIVAEWLAGSKENENYYNQFRLIWEQSKKLEARSNVDTEEAWQRFQQKVARAARPEAKTVPVRPRNTLKIAASLIFILGAAWLVYFLAGRNEMHTLASNEEVMTDTLSDGSVVTLNRHSTITYPEDFRGDTRAVSMEGEAFFNITPDKNKPFIISANGIDVKVVGTSFNVKSSAAQTEVIVETGVVEVSKQKAFVTLKPNQQAIIRKTDAAPVKMENKDELYNYYRSKEFVCNNTPLWRLVDVLKEAYNADIIIEDERLKNQLLTTTFHNDSLDNILAVIGDTFNAAITKSSGRYILKPR